MRPLALAVLWLAAVSGCRAAWAECVRNPGASPGSVGRGPAGAEVSRTSSGLSAGSAATGENAPQGRDPKTDVSASATATTSNGYMNCQNELQRLLAAKEELDRRAQRGDISSLLASERALLIKKIATVKTWRDSWTPPPFLAQVKDAAAAHAKDSEWTRDDELDKELEHYEAAIRAPQRPDLDLNRRLDSLATSRGGLREREELARDISERLRQNPNDAQALLARARLKHLSGDARGAMEDARRLLTFDPDNAVAKLILGSGGTLVNAGAGLGKIKHFMRDPGDGGALDGGAAGDGGGTRRANTAALVSQGDQSYAQASAVSFAGGASQAGVGPSAAALSAAPTPAGYSANWPWHIELPPGYRLFLERAAQKLRLGDFKGALLDASLATDQNPHLPHAWALRAEVDNALKNHPAAIADAGKALAIEPLNAQALRARAYAHLQEGNYRVAFDDATSALQANPQSGLAYLYRAMAAEKLGDLETARRDFEAAVRLDPSLKPLAEESLGHLVAPVPKPGLSEAMQKKLIRGGALALSLLLVLFGLLGTERGRKAVTTVQRLFAGTETPKATAPNATLLEGTVLGNTCRVVGELGRGGMGVVYEAFDETLQRRVAVKQLRKDSRTTREDVHRFLSEARLAARLKHPNLAQIYAAIEDGDLYLVFEYIQGQPLDALLAANGALSLKRARLILADVCSAVDYAHSQRIIHRDLKPGNVMLADDGACKVMDFGIAHQARTASAQTQATAASTPPYMAPEQALGSVSKASDLYALGVMAYELVTGTRPFDNQGHLDAKLKKQFPRATTRRDALPGTLDAVFDRALEPDPAKRFQSAAEFLKAFAACC